ncbi:MAG: hypothetical protein A3K19_28920 [Lentisphaerae bacterium RIFOXYB12_FULL_65_16]|nr:MAG: hypothetical protein A3K19_28920 [Lentisphaerae bacterium RIFOXYB12_FULL_65_16]
MRVTTKGQVTIPARIRGYLGIQPHADVDFQIRKGLVVLVKAGQARKAGRTKFESMRGILAGRLTTDQWMKATRGD